MMATCIVVKPHPPSTCTHNSIHVQCTCIGLYTYVHVRVHVCVHVRVHVRVHVCVHVHYIVQSCMFILGSSLILVCP